MNAMELLIKFDNWLKANPERFTKNEQEKVIANFRKFLTRENKEQEYEIEDELYDFLSTLGIVLPRHEKFAKFIISKYPIEKYKEVLDVGAGRLCKLSEYLSSKGYNVTAIDPNIRLKPDEAKKKKIKIINGLFECDTETKKGTDITKYDLIIGLEPCDATEHIIRQCAKYNKHSSILLCATSHDALDGTKFEDEKSWYQYLNDLFPTTSISNIELSTVISNSIIRERDEK